jgi:hypothetical protein
LARFGVFQANLPRTTARRGTRHSDIAPEIYQVVADATGQGQVVDAINGILLANAPEIQSHACKREPDAPFIPLHPLPPHKAGGLAHVFFIRNRHMRFPVIPKLQQWQRRGIEHAIGRPVVPIAEAEQFYIARLQRRPGFRTRRIDPADEAAGLEPRIAALECLDPRDGLRGEGFSLCHRRGRENHGAVRTHGTERHALEIAPRLLFPFWSCWHRYHLRTTIARRR